MQNVAVVADRGLLADDDAGRVVDRKSAAEARARVYVDTVHVSHLALQQLLDQVSCYD